MISILKYKIIMNSLLSFNSNFGDATFLMSQVCEEKERMQVVPKTEIPIWFDYAGSGNNPIFWARRNFPIVALAFEFGEVKESDEMKMNTLLNSRFLPELMSDKSYTIDLHLYIEGQEICRKDFHYCSVGKHHVLMCDFETLINDEEWKSLDAFLGDDWKTIQVQCESQLILNHWGIYVYKQKTNTNDIRFSFPYSTDYMTVPSSLLVPKSSPNQKMRHLQSLDLVETFSHYLNTFKSELCASVANELLGWCRYAMADVKGEPHSACVYGTSLIQEHVEHVWYVGHILEMLMRSEANPISDAQVQSAGQVVVDLLTTKAQHVKEKGHEALYINMSIPIILEECECLLCTDLVEQLESSQSLLPQQKKIRVKAQREDVQNEEMRQEKPRGTGESLFWKGAEHEVSTPSRRYWGSI